MVVWVAWSFLHTDVKLLSSAPSPDGQYQARAVVNMGGGAAGFCYKCVLVQASSEPFDVAKALCDRSPHLVHCGGTFQLAWLDSRSLQVTHSEPGLEMPPKRGKSSDASDVEIS